MQNNNVISYIKFFAACVIMQMSVHANAQLADWKPFRGGTKFPTNLVGQINGMTRITQLKFHPTDSNKMYAITSQGGFFKTTDGGNNWSVAVGTESQTTNSSSVCIDYTNEQHVLLGTGDPNYYSNGIGVMESTDGGATYTATSLTNCLVIEIIQNPLNSLEYVAATNKGIYKSTNGGSVWNAVTATTVAFVDMVKNANPTSQVLYAATKDNNPIFYRSTDFGSTWTNTTNGLVYATKYITGGARIGVTPADTNVVYFEGIGGGGIVHKSNDQGLNFVVKKPQGLPCITFYNETDTTSSSQGNYNNAICVDRYNPARLWLQSHNTMYSTDSGATWTRLTFWASKVHTDMHQLIQAPYNSNKLFSCNDGGIWVSVDGGNNWVPKCDGIFAYEIGNNTGVGSLVRKDFVSIGTQDNARLYGDSTGWYTISGGDDYAKRQFDYNGHIYIDGTRRQLNHTGSSVSYNLPTLNWTAFGFNRMNKNLAFMAQNDSLYRTFNLSASTPTWTYLGSMGSNVRAIHSCIADTNKLYVLLTNGDMKISYDATYPTPTFTASNLPGSATSTGSVVAMANNANIVYVAENSGVYMSSDSGLTWTNIKYNLPTVNHIRILAEEYGGTKELVMLATNNAVYYKKAGQTTWTIYSTGLPSRKSPTEFSLFDNGTTDARIRYATYGRGLWESPISNLREMSAQILIANDTTITCSNPTIQYADGSVGLNNTPITYQWTFPGGSPSASNAVNPAVTYATNGTYTATLKITNSLGDSSVQTISRYIQVIPCSSDTIPGKAIYVDGSTGYAKTGNIVWGNTNNITLMAWIKIETNQASYAGILFSSNDGATGLNFRNGNQLGYHWKNLSSSYNFSGGPTVPLGVWNHVAFVVNPSSATLYLNGVPYSNAIAHATANFTGSFNFGNDRNNASRTMNGMLDEICFYNRALTQNEIREQMHLSKNYGQADTNLKVYYQCNETGNIIYNRAGTVHATLQGNAAHVVSTAPVGSGVFDRISVTSSGIKTFANAGVNISFGSGVNPNGEMVVTRLNIQPDSFPVGTNFTKLSSRYWHIHNYGTNATIAPLNSISFAGYGLLGLNDSLNMKKFRLYKRSSGEYLSSSWSLNDSANALNPGTLGQVGFSGNNVTSFSEFTIFNSYIGNILPVQLIAFNASCDKREANVLWKTGSEFNSNYFAIEYSYDGSNWSEINQTPAAGNSSVEKSYGYVHKNLTQDNLYYRLKIVDINNQFSYSNVITVNCTPAVSSALVYPIPFDHYVYINNRELHYRILDVTGRVVHEGNEKMLNTSSWANGLYILNIENQYVKFLKEK